MAVLLLPTHPEPPTVTCWMDTRGRVWRFRSGKVAAGWRVGHNPFRFRWNTVESAYADAFPLAQLNSRTLRLSRRERLLRALHRRRGPVSC